jgi:hypothetical protein
MAKPKKYTTASGLKLNEADIDAISDEVANNDYDVEASRRGDAAARRSAPVPRTLSPFASTQSCAPRSKRAPRPTT